MKSKNAYKAYEEYPIEWVEVTGYKAVREDMTSWYDENYKYELGKENICEGEIKLCENGLHFCPQLFDLMFYADILASRIFEVKAVIDKNDIARRKFINPVRAAVVADADDENKVAKSITFVRELSAEEVWDTFKDKIKDDCEEVQSLEDFIRFRFKTLEDIKRIIFNDLLSEMLAAGYSEIFSTFLLEKMIGSYRARGIMTAYPLVDKELFNYAIALAGEGVSTDMRAYLLSKKMGEK